MSSVKFSTAPNSFYTEVKKRISEYFKEVGKSSTGNFSLFIKAIALVVAYLLLYTHLVFFTPVTWLALIECVVLGGLTAAIGFNVMHDGMHGSFSRYKWVNKLAGLSLNFLGANNFMWKTKHNIIHHTYTNIEGIDDDIEIIPAHAWTPWYGLFGSMSGFDSVEECFKEQSKHIYAIETGLSSDPAMNWRLSKLDKYTLVSSSDAHSFWPWRLGREANVFDIDWSYDDLLQAIRKKKGFAETIEMWPHEGKYHYTGHRLCNVVLSPKEALKLKNICPKCRKPLTVGVAQRVEQLADREEGFMPENAVPFRNLIPLSEIIAGTAGHAVSSRQVWEEYHKLINAFGNEFEIMLNAEEKELKKITTEKIAENILRNRFQKIPFKPGYDGVYGVPIFDGEDSIKHKEENQSAITQKGLDEFM